MPQNGKAYSPLDEQDLQNLNACIAACEQNRQFIEQCENCTVKMPDQIQRNNQLADFFRKVKAQFFPNEP